MLYRLIRNFLFKLDPETSHYLTLNSLKFFYQIGLVKKKNYYSPRTVMGLNFENPLGLAAGLDKNGDYIDALAALGFGFIEIGTVTPRPQPGNPKPRMFRLPEAKALINRLGFNNKGVDYLVENVKRMKYSGILGINIGKNFDTSIENAVTDYLLCMRKVYPYASYITINISSPNTPDLRKLQFGNYLNQMLQTLKEEQTVLQIQYKKYVPLVIKISPDLTSQELTEIATSLLQHNIDGVIATNTTVSREEVKGLKYASEVGGLSGKPLMEKSTAIVQQLQQILQGKIPIIAVGGIVTTKDAKEKFHVGANLIQIYTGFIYQGPRLITEILQAVS